MRRFFALFALAATLGLHYLDIYRWNEKSKFLHSVYIDGQSHVDVDLNGLEKAKPRLEAYELAMLLNAPSATFFLPIELSTWGMSQERFRDIRAFHERILWEFGLFGILVWYAAGKFIDDARAAWSEYPEMNLRWYDWTFSILCLLSGFVMASMGMEESDLNRVYTYFGFAWMLLGAISLLFRLFQWRSLRNARSLTTS